MIASAPTTTVGSIAASDSASSTRQPSDAERSATVTAPPAA